VLQHNNTTHVYFQTNLTKNFSLKALSIQNFALTLDEKEKSSHVTTSKFIAVEVQQGKFVALVKTTN
jgi:hypothetical protein